MGNKDYLGTLLDYAVALEDYTAGREAFRRLEESPQSVPLIGGNFEETRQAMMGNVRNAKERVDTARSVIGHLVDAHRTK